MSQLKQAVKNNLPAPVLDLMRNTWDSLVRVKDWPAAAFHPWRRETKTRLPRFHNLHKGERCFIIGNGPSLKKTDLSLLRSENTFGMNRFFLAFPELGFQTTYFLSVNDLVIEQSTQEISQLKMPVFVAWRARRWLQPSENLHFLYTSYTGVKFARDLRGRLWEGATVTYTALQIAFYMGFQQVILIGVDHNFVTKGKPNTTVVSGSDDPNHFHPAYFGKGFRWQLPDLETSEKAYWLAKRVYEQDGRSVLDATVDGKLTVFPKVSYVSLFK